MALLATGGCARPFRVNAHLAIAPDRLEFADSPPRFLSCPSCPETSRDLPGGQALTVTISPEALYSLTPGDITQVAIYEERSVFVRDTRTYTVIVTPTPAWLSESEVLRDSYPYDTVAWLESGQLVAVGPNINLRQQGSFSVAAFFCRDHAVQFAASFGLEPEYIVQGDSEYTGLLKRLNTNYQEALADIKANQESVADRLPEIPPDVLGALISDGYPELPIEPSVYYGSSYDPIVCQ